jgi:hypothetical protein
MRALGRHQRKNDDIMAAPFSADADAQTCQSAADHQNIGVDYLHGLSFFLVKIGSRNFSRQDAKRAKNSVVISSEGRNLSFKIPHIRAD